MLQDGVGASFGAESLCAVWQENATRSAAKPAKVRAEAKQEEEVRL